MLQLLRDIPENPDQPTALAIGNFDGAHRGHAAVIAAMHKIAASQQLLPSVLTFEPHPRAYFSRESAPFRLIAPRSKWRALQALGVARIYSLRFNAALASMPAERFVEAILLQRLGAKAIVTGEDFCFGAKRRGNVAMLRDYGAAHGVTVETVGALAHAGEVVSSSAIRAALSAGDMAHVATLLGRAYTLSGHVARGDGRGRGLGFATANVTLPRGVMLPPLGVYAVTVTGLGPGVANLGLRPSFAGGTAPRLEVHLFDLDRDLYGQRLEVAFHAFLRPERRFEDVQALVAQIEADAATARALLSAC